MQHLALEELSKYGCFRRSKECKRMLKEGDIRFVREGRSKTNTTSWTVLYEELVVWINKVHDNPRDFRYVVYDYECRQKGLTRNKFLQLLLWYIGCSVNTKRSGREFFRYTNEWENIAVENPGKYDSTRNRPNKRSNKKKSKRDREHEDKDSSEVRDSEDTEQRKKPKEDAVDTSVNANSLKLEQLQNLAFKIEVKDGNLLFHLPLSIMNAMNK